MSNIQNIEIKKIRVFPELYPRDQIDTEQVNLYRLNLEKLPPILLNQDFILIDGAHRLQAYEVAQKTTIPAEIKDIPKDQIFIEAIRYNAMHGKQLSREEKAKLIRKLYQIGMNEQELEGIFAVSTSTIQRFLKDIKEKQSEEQEQVILDLYLQCKTLDEVSEVIGVHKTTISRSLEKLQNGQLTEMQSSLIPESLQLTDNWKFGTPDPRYGTPSYPGRASGQAIENFLYYCTNPFDIVVDPMAGGGTTGDVCKAMYRRCLMYDLHPLKSRPDILQHDITTGFPKKVTQPHFKPQAIFLDPPYWQMKNEDYKTGSVSDLDREGFMRFIQKLVSDSYQVLQEKGYLGFLFQDSYRGFKGIYKAVTKPLFTAELFPYFLDVGFEPVYWITYPLSLHIQYNATKTQLAKDNKILLHVLLHFLIFQKTGFEK